MRVGRQLVPIRRLCQQPEDHKVVAQETHASCGSLRAAREREGGVCSVSNAREHVEFQGGFQSACPMESVNGFKNQLQRGSRCLARLSHSLSSNERALGLETPWPPPSCFVPKMRRY